VDPPKLFDVVNIGMLVVASHWRLQSPPLHAEQE